MAITDREIREYLGHNGKECRVRIANKNGRAVTRRGSPDPESRGYDYWRFMGWRAEIVAQIEAERKAKGTDR